MFSKSWVTYCCHLCPIAHNGGPQTLCPHTSGQDHDLLMSSEDRSYRVEHWDDSCILQSCPKDNPCDELPVPMPTISASQKKPRTMLAGELQGDAKLHTHMVLSRVSLSLGPSYFASRHEKMYLLINNCLSYWGEGSSQAKIVLLKRLTVTCSRAHNTELEVHSIWGQSWRTHNTIFNSASRKLLKKNLLLSSEILVSITCDSHLRCF